MKWFKHKAEITHYCAGVEGIDSNTGGKLKKGKKQPAEGFWFNPVLEEEGDIICKACGTKATKEETQFITIGE